MSYPQFSGYQLGSIVQDIADLETNLGGAITALQSDISGVITDVDSVKTEVLAIPKSPIKSISSGIVVFGDTVLSRTISVSSYNPAKSFVTINGDALSTGGTDQFRIPYLSAKTSTNFTLTFSSNIYASFNNIISWQLIEYE